MTKSRAKIYEEARLAKEARRAANTEFILPNNLKQLRNAKYISQADLAEELGVCKSTISMWEHGIKGVKDKNKLELCRVLKCSITELFNWEE